MPLPMLLSIGVLGLLILWFTQRKFTASLLIVLSFTGIFLASFKPVSSMLLASIEQQYKGYTPTSQPVDYIMVLGNDHILDNNQPITSELSRTAVVRLAEGIRIHRLHPEAKLIFSGYSGSTPISQAQMMARAAEALGVSKDNMLLLETPQDTAEEAIQAAAIIGNKHVILVTSASHMPRALKEFKQHGINPIPAPTEFLSRNNSTMPVWQYTPKAEYLEQTEDFWRETMGLWWQKIRLLFANSSSENSANKQQQYAFGHTLFKKSELI